MPLHRPERDATTGKPQLVLQLLHFMGQVYILHLIESTSISICLGTVDGSKGCLLCLECIVWSLNLYLKKNTMCPFLRFSCLRFLL